MKSFLPFIVTAIAAGCIAPGQMPVKAKKPKNSQSYKVDYLFEHDGCKVYRFYDAGNWVYFTNCKGEAIMKTDSMEVRNTISR